MPMSERLKAEGIHMAPHVLGRPRLDVMRSEGGST
jgi:hypothetical protein